MVGGVRRMTITIAKEFSKNPLGRFYPKDGDFTGDKFRNDFLIPALKDKSNQTVTVVIDGTEGYGSSFLEEAFGGLVREKVLSAEELKKRLKIENKNPNYSLYRELIWKYIDEAIATLKSG